MADFGCSEKQSIKDSGKYLKKYGSTCNHLKRPEYYVTHIVQKTDTLQGLALKYNTTTEQIRRINRLFASDSLFLRDHLKIPVNRELANSVETNNSELSYESASNATSPMSTESCAGYEDDDDDAKTVNDLFGKIDNSIASTRALVKQVQEHSSVLSDSTYPGVYANSHYPKSSRQSRSASISSSNEMFATPHPVVLNRGRKVKSSLQRLEKEQDELFEL